MSTPWPRPLEPGDEAPGFELPAVDRDGTLRLEDFRGRSAVLLGLFRGLFCPFCRRQIAQLGASVQSLRMAGTETVGVVIAPARRGRLYFRFHPAPIPLAADETAQAHRAFGVPRFEVVPDDAQDAAAWPYAVTETAVSSIHVNPGGMYPEPIPVEEASRQLNEADGYEWTEEDAQTQERHWTQLGGLFLIDRSGVVRWRHLEGVDEPSDFGSFPSEATLLAAVQSLG
jgi:peroxiredoxin